MSEIKSTLTHAGPIEEGYAGIDGAFMIKNRLVIVIAAVVDEDGGLADGSIMLHPHMRADHAEDLIPLINELTRQANTVLRSMAADNGAVH